MDGTLAENIIGYSVWDPNWLDAVITVVDLHKDITTLPLGLLTPVGAKGSRLSGG